jgi:hypothetical protein
MLPASSEGGEGGSDAVVAKGAPGASRGETKKGEDDVQAAGVATSPTRRGRGRPNKYPDSEFVTVSTSSPDRKKKEEAAPAAASSEEEVMAGDTEVPAKKKRGRPPGSKNRVVVVADGINVVSSSTVAEPAAAPKRARGRPRKAAAAVAVAAPEERKKRGRPAGSRNKLKAATNSSGGAQEGAGAEDLEEAHPSPKKPRRGRSPGASAGLTPVEPDKRRPGRPRKISKAPVRRINLGGINGRGHSGVVVGGVAGNSSVAATPPPANLSLAIARLETVVQEQQSEIQSLKAKLKKLHDMVAQQQLSSPQREEG